MIFGRAEYDLSADWTSENEGMRCWEGDWSHVGTKGEERLRDGTREYGEEGMLQ